MEIEMSTEKNVERLLDRVSVIFVGLFATLYSARTLSDSTNALCVSAGLATRFPLYRDLAFPTSPASTPSTSTLSSTVPTPTSSPIFDNVFDLVFSTGATEALFLARFVSQMERTVRRGRAIVLAVDLRSSAQEMEEIKALLNISILFEGEE